MALIKCPECKKNISTTVDTCPHCGYKLSAEDKILAETVDPNRSSVDNYTSSYQYQPINNRYYDSGSTGIGFILGFFLGIIGLIIALCLDKPDTRTGAAIGFVVELLLSIPLLLILL